MNLGRLLIDHPFTDDQPLLYGPTQTWTAGDARRRVDQITAGLASQGIRRGDLVAVRRSGGEGLLAMVAVWLSEAVVVPINDRLPEAGVKQLLRQTGSVVVVEPDGTIIRLKPSGPTEPQSTGLGPAFVLWTSGTSGDPTPIVHHHEAYLALIDRVLGPLSANRDRSKPPSPNLIPVPLALNAGMYNCLFGLRAGAPLVLMDRFCTSEFADLVTRHRIRSTVLPPAALAMLNDDPDIETLEPLRYVRSITAPLSPFQARRFSERFGAFVLNGYGQAELGEVIGWTARDAKSHPNKLGAAGRPHPGVEVNIADPDPTGTGELMVRPPDAIASSVASALGGRLRSDGFVATGDLARLDSDGFVWVEGRLGDVVNRGGNKVVPAEVEEILSSVPGVVEAAVVGRPDPRLGEVPIAVVVGDAADEDLVAACRAHLAPYKVPAAIERADALPRNEVGKLLRRALR